MLTGNIFQLANKKMLILYWCDDQRHLCEFLLLECLFNIPFCDEYAWEWCVCSPALDLNSQP